MNDMAKVGRSGGNQTVELPEGDWFATSEVSVSRDGDRVVLEPIDAETGLPLSKLRALIDEGMEGEAVPLDMAEIKRAARLRFLAER